MLAIEKASVRANMFNSFARVAFSKKTFHFETPCMCLQYMSKYIIVSLHERYIKITNFNAEYHVE